MDIIFEEVPLPFKLGLGNKNGKITRVLVHHKGNFYIVSENTALKETLVFSASPTGEILDWVEVGGGNGLTLKEVLANFDQNLHSEMYF